MSPRDLRSPVLLVVVLLGTLAGCGSAKAPAPDPDAASGRSVQQTCPLLGTALRKGFVGSTQLVSLADTAGRLVRAGDEDTKQALSALPEDARALANTPDSEQDLTRFQQAVSDFQKACTDQGTPMRY